MRFLGRHQKEVPHPLARGQYLVGLDLDDLIAHPEDLHWVSLLFHGASLLAAHGAMPQGQLLQDALAAGVIDAAAAPRTYLEVGGGPPRDHSNTFALDHAGWVGTVVEPNPDLADEYSRVRSDRMMLVAKGVSADGVGTATFVSAGEVSYVQGAGAPPADMWSAAREAAVAKRAVHLIETIHPEQLWSDVIDAVGVPSFLSVDVEGAELAILGDLPFDSQGPLVVCAEHSGDGERATALERLMVDRGYTRILVKASQWDGWFVRSDVALTLEG